jgi:protein involved in polysaccharide export with SLBB domain
MHFVTQSKIAWAWLAFALAAGTPGHAQGNLREVTARAAAARPHPGDRVVLHVYGQPLLSDSATVDERGMVTLPKVGLIQADTFTIAALRDVVRQQMATFLRDPTIEVAVLRRVVVGGEVEKPGVQYADLAATIPSVVANAGGLKESGSASRVYVLRDGARIAIPAWQVDTSAVAGLRSGDVVMVGRRSWLALNLLSFISVSTTVAALVISLSK